MLLYGKDLSKQFEETPLFENVSIFLEPRDKIGLIGLNGSGKSTLLKILAFCSEADSGEVWKDPDVKIAYLAQDPIFNEKMSILEHVLHDVNQQDRELKEHEAKAILTKFGFEDFHKQIQFCSGGEKRRVALASVLVQPSDVLILDEPTNHLDSDIIEWLEKTLIRYTGAMLMVTHDRYFLERITNQIMELDQGKGYLYQANYSTFIELKMQREEYLLASERKRQIRYQKELEWMRRGPRARTTKSKYRMDQFDKLKDSEPIPQDQTISISTVQTRLGKKTIELDRVGKKFDQWLFRGFSMMVDREDRIGFIGANGTGKTTLFRIISREIEPDEGSIIVGDTVKIGFFSQDNQGMNAEERVIDHIRTIAEVVQTEDGPKTASAMLETFQFNREKQFSPIGKLSGGEKRRLHLLSVLMSSPNILLLDEPTNDLDIDTLTILESYIDEFAGAVLVISHDRYFIDRVVERVFVLQDKDQIETYNGGYTTYLEKKKSKEKQSKDFKISKERNKPKMLKLTYLEQKELESMEETIAKVEIELKEIEQLIELQHQDYEKVRILYEKKSKLDQSLEKLFNRWSYLSQIADQSTNKKEV